MSRVGLEGKHGVWLFVRMGVRGGEGSGVHVHSNRPSPSQKSIPEATEQEVRRIRSSERGTFHNSNVIVSTFTHAHRSTSTHLGAQSSCH